MELAGARTLITGASGGIGRAVTTALIDAGAQVLLSGRDPVALAEATAAAERHGAAAGDQILAALPANLAVESDRQDLVDSLAADPGGLDLVVLAAGVGHRDSASGHSMAEVERLIGLNLIAQIRLVQGLAPLMGAGRPARIVLVGSIAGLLGVPEESVYAASKAGLALFADSVRTELRPAGIGITLLVPGVVDTDFFDRRGAAYGRRFPPPIPASRVARALVRGLARNAEEIVVPGWLRIPLVLRQVAPQVYRRAAARWG